jgi:lysyl-tRNA synthetase class 2
MATLKELRDEKLRKLEQLRKLGVNPYPTNSKRTHLAAEVVNQFGKLEGKKVSLTGRIVNIRKFGKIAFIILKDSSGQLQLFLKDGELSDADHSASELSYSEINLLDTSDFVEATGKVIKTKTGEISVLVDKLRILAKSLRSLPTSQEGFANKEERLRRRYVDTNVNKEVYERFVRRSKFWEATRDFLNQNGFLEVNTPVLEHTTGGADAKPFKTHMDALDQDFYLRISQELPLKRLIGGGYEKVYDIGPRFRNENYSDEHLPEHIAMEWYWAYADAEDGKRFTADLFRYVYNEVYGKLKFNIRGFEIDLAKDWNEIDYADVIQKNYGIDVFETNMDQVKAKLKEHKLEVEKADNLARGIDKLWKKVRATLAGPSTLVNMPVHLKPLAKTDPKNPKVVQHFHPIIAGSELGNGYSELNDPIEQLKRFMEQQAMRDAGDLEAQMLDIDFVEMLEYGMPPTCGYGHSERNFWFFEGVTAREGVPFPQMRSDTDQSTKSVYPELFKSDGQ